MSEVYDFIKKLLVENMSIDEGKVTMESNIIEDLGADSLDIMDLINDVEKEYNIQIPQEEYGNLKTVGDVVKLVEGKKQ